MIRRPAGLVAIAALAVAGCSTPPASTGPDEEILVLEVAADTRTCVGEMEQECLQVRAPGEDSWRLFYETIEGFDREPGVRYVLEVARRTVERPPADASRYAYRLVRVLERDPDPQVVRTPPSAYLRLR